MDTDKLVRPLYHLFTDLSCKTWAVTCVQSNKHKTYKGRCNHLSVSITVINILADTKSRQPSGHPDAVPLAGDCRRGRMPVREFWTHPGSQLDEQGTVGLPTRGRLEQIMFWMNEVSALLRCDYLKAVSCLTYKSYSKFCLYVCNVCKITTARNGSLGNVNCSLKAKFIQQFNYTLLAKHTQMLLKIC